MMSKNQLEIIMNSKFRHYPEGKLILAIITQAWEESGSKDLVKRRAAQQFFQSEDFKEYLRFLDEGENV